MRRSRICLTRLWQRFLADEVREDSKYQQKQAIICRRAKRHLNFFKLHKMLELNQLIRILFMRNSRIICQRGSNLTSFLDDWREDPQMPLKVAHHWPFEREPFTGGQLVAKQWVLAWLLCDFPGDPYKYCWETLYIYDFLEGGLAYWIWMCIPNINIDPNQMATEEAIWSRSTLFLTLFLAGLGVDPLSRPFLWIRTCCSYVKPYPFFTLVLLAEFGFAYLTEI